MNAMIDWTGDPNDVAVKAGVLISRLDAPDELHGFMGAIDWFGSVIVGAGVHRPDRMQSWLTHFSVVLEFQKNDGNRELWLVERSDQGVCLHPYDADGFEWRKFSLRGDQMLSSTPHWNGDDFTVPSRQDVRYFVGEQNQIPYIVDKNCQHFAYDCLRYYLQHPWLQVGGQGEHFSSFSEMLQQGWVENRGW
ncbi:hypothetical protein ACHAWO_006472 [Cyclotella atomus]|uniref:PPPDE domain-containing protein n=1 Tax=Cyclotella atomus TaxID=382360 RepID=A0ABD3Q1D2_9STRA